MVSTFEAIYDETGDAEAHGIATQLAKYRTVACYQMYYIPYVAKLQGSMQGKEIDLATVPAMVDSTTKRLKELKEKVDSTIFLSVLRC